MTNSRGEYGEPIEKDTKYRADYARGIEEYLLLAKEEANKKSGAFITPENYCADSEKYRRRLIDQLGFPLKSRRKKPILAERKMVTRDGNVDIERIVLRCVGNIPVYGLLFSQAERREDVPFIIAFHGGQGTPELISGIHLDSTNYHHIVRRLTDRGADVFVPQLLLWDEKTYGNPKNRAKVDARLRQLGGSVTALELRCAEDALDFFLSEGIVRSKRVGTVGLSYGGMYALYLAAIDTRIRVCYSSSWLCDIFEQGQQDWSYKGFANTFSSVGVPALVCPRPLVIAMGRRDEMFDYRETAAICDRVSAYFKAFSCPDRFLFVPFEGTHEIDKGDGELDFFFKRLEEAHDE